MRYTIDPTRSVYAQIPESPANRPMAASIGSAIYRFYDTEGSLLYVGMTARPRERWFAHSRTAEWWPLVGSVTISGRTKEHAARGLERKAIETELPLFNVAMAVSPHV